MIAAYRPYRIGEMAVTAYERLRSQGMIEPLLPPITDPVRSIRDPEKDDPPLTPDERRRAVAARNVLDLVLAALRAPLRRAQDGPLGRSTSRTSSSARSTCCATQRARREPPGGAASPTSWSTSSRTPTGSSSSSSRRFAAPRHGSSGSATSSSRSTDFATPISPSFASSGARRSPTPRPRSPR